MGEVLQMRPTRAEVNAAKRATEQERREIFAQTGLVIRDDGHMVASVIVVCPKVGCTHEGVGPTLGLAIRDLAKHIVQAHPALVQPRGAA